MNMIQSHLGKRCQAKASPDHGYAYPSGWVGDIVELPDTDYLGFVKTVWRGRVIYLFPNQIARIFDPKTDQSVDPT